jgi:nicotinamide mononucleotide transporter
MSELYTYFAPGPFGLYSHLGEILAQLWADPFSLLLLMATSQLEWAAVIFTLVGVILAGRQNVWSWPIGLVGVVLYAIVFYGVALKSDVLLQVYFFITTFYGWWLWGVYAKHNGMEGSAKQVHVRLLLEGLAFWRTPRVREPEVIVTKLATRTFVLLLTGSVVAAALIAVPMHYVGAGLPFWDGLILTASVVAQILLARKVAQSWWLWVFINIVAIGVYSTKGLYSTTVLYGFFLINAIYWGIRWHRLHAAQRTEARTSVPRVLRSA